MLANTEQRRRSQRIGEVNKIGGSPLTSSWEDGV